MKASGAVRSIAITIAITIASTLVSMPAQVSGIAQCERMTHAECSFNNVHKYTAFPNLKGDQNIEDAIKQYNQFNPMLRLNCSPLLQQLLCFYIFPACIEKGDFAGPQIYLPCRSLCELVKTPCDRALRAHPGTFSWDDTEIRCEQLPETSDSPYCISEDSESDFATTAVVNQSTTVSAFVSHRSSCEQTVIKLHNTYMPKCGAHVLFNTETKQFTTVWMIVWSSLCCVASFLTFITILRDKVRFPYPERPVMFLALCYFGYSLAYLVRAFAGPFAVSCERNQKCDVLVREEMQPLCMIVFIIGYFFSLSAAVWWLMFTVGWLLSAAVKWSSEAIESRSSYFHLFAWAAPACLTSVVIVMRKVEGDELTGLCLVGVSRDEYLLLFQIVPHAVLLFVSIVLLAAGFISMTRIRNELFANCKEDADKLEKLIAKVAVSAGFYIVPNLAILACFVYQYVNIPTWNAAVKRTGERHETRPTSENLPIAELFIFQIFMSFAVGISQLMWISSTKTLHSWRACLTPQHGNGSTSKRFAVESAQPSYMELPDRSPRSPTAVLTCTNGNYRLQHSFSASRNNHSHNQSRAMQANATPGETKAFLSSAAAPLEVPATYTSPFGAAPTASSYFVDRHSVEKRLASVNPATPPYSSLYCQSQHSAQPVMVQYKPM